MSQLDQSASFAVRESHERYSAYTEADVLVGWRRIMAAAVDTVLLAIVLLSLITRYGSGTKRWAFHYTLPAALRLLPNHVGFWVWYPNLPAAVSFVVIAVTYFTLFESIFGWSLGKCIFGLRVVDFFGKRPSMYQSFTRNAFRALDGFPFFVPNLLGFVVMNTNRRRQRAGDKAAGTLVVDWQAYQMARLRKKAEMEGDLPSPSPVPAVVEA